MLPGRCVVMIPVEHLGGVVDCCVGWSWQSPLGSMPWDIGAMAGAGGRLVCSGVANHGPWLAMWRQPWWGVLGVQSPVIGEGAAVGHKLGGSMGTTVGSVVGLKLADVFGMAGVVVGVALSLWVGLKVSWAVHAS